MAYDEALAERIRGILAKRDDVTETKMFGGIAFMVRGHMSVGILEDDLMVRVGPDAYGSLVKRPHARPMDFTGRPMKGFLFVSAPALQSYVMLEKWIRHGVDHAETLPAKAGKLPAAPKPRKSRSIARPTSRPAARR